MNTVKVMVNSVSGQITEVQIAPEVVEAARALPHSPERYFEMRNSISLPVPQLVLSRSRPEGIANALKLMLAAYNGLQPRRAPIDVRRLDNERYLVLDGNSTAIVAVASGWPAIPCLVIED